MSVSWSRGFKASSYSAASLLRVMRIALLTCFVVLTGLSQADTAVPALTGHVVDLTGTLSAAQKDTLNQTLTSFETRKGSQLAVLIVPTTVPESIEQFGIRVADKWKLGRKKIDDGVILIIAKNDHSVRIEVGYGLEGALTDALSKRIIEQIIVPRFKEQDFYGGINEAATQIMRVVDGEPLQAPAANSDSLIDQALSLAPMLVVIVILAGGFFRRMFGRLASAIVSGLLSAGLAWFLVGHFLLAILTGIAGFVFSLILGFFGGRTGGGFYNGGSGPGGSSSTGSGGFSGGGGGFGGGGASGKW